MYKRQTIIAKMCGIVAMAYQVQGDYSHASDCFCQSRTDFQHDGKTVQYVQKAVEEKLIRDGYNREMIEKIKEGVLFY